MKARLQLREYWVEDFQWRPAKELPEASEVRAGALPTVRVDVYQPEGNSEYFVRLEVWLSAGRATKANEPYQFRLRVVGQFYFLEGTPQELQEWMIYANGASILYGIARTMLAEGTSSGRAGRYILPSINFIEVLKRSSQLKESSPPKLE